MKKKKHIYVNELELKSILIRVKNLRENITKDKTHNKRINQLINTFLKLNNLKYQNQESTKKKIQLKDHLQKRIIELSEKTCADKLTYNRFGSVVVLTIKNILRKPQFNGYTYSDDFYSDASYKILKYLKNFDHTKISEVSEQPVKAFAYLTQIINNSIIFIINKYKKINDNVATEIQRQKLITNINNKQSLYNDPFFREVKPEKISVFKNFSNNDFLATFENFVKSDLSKYNEIKFSIPDEFKLNIDTLALKEHLKRECYKNEIRLEEVKNV